VAKLVRLTAYARNKLSFLRAHGFEVEEAAVISTVVEPDHVSHARLGRWVAQRALTERHLLRVIYEEWAHERLVITVYPARRSRYESTHDV